MGKVAGGSAQKGLAPTGEANCYEWLVRTADTCCRDKKMSGSKVEGRRSDGGSSLRRSLRLLHTLALTEGERRGPTQTRTIALIDLRDLSSYPVIGDK